MLPGPDVTEVLEFWFGPTWQSAGPVPAERRKLWFGGGEAVDQSIRERFTVCLESAAAGACDWWRDSSEGTLALILVLDQFSRNIHRNTPRAFAYDARALEVCMSGMDLGFDLVLPLLGRAFFYLPLEHAEDLAMQQMSVTMFATLCDLAPEEQDSTFASFYDYAVRHHDVIARFGRYPHRNRILGRDSTDEERSFLLQPGSSF